MKTNILCTCERVPQSKIVKFQNTYCFTGPFPSTRRNATVKSTALEKFIKTLVGFRRKFQRNFETRSWMESSKVGALRILFHRRRFIRQEIHYVSKFPTDRAVSFAIFPLIAFRLCLSTSDYNVNEHFTNYNE